MKAIEKYPDIKIVSDQGAGNAELGQSVGENVLTAFPDLAGAWTSWDGPAAGLAAAARTQNKPKDFAITTHDLSKEAAIAIARSS